MTFFENDRPVPKANKDLACGSAERLKPHEKDYIELTYPTILRDGVMNSKENWKHYIERKRAEARSKALLGAQKRLAELRAKREANLTNKPKCAIVYGQFGDKKK